MSNELIVIEQKNVLSLFTESDQIEGLLSQIEMEIKTFEHDMSNESRRKKTASLARKVASTKTYLDDLGKDLVSQWKTQAKIVDVSRKNMRDRLDELKVLARKPLTDWEDEQKAIKEAELKRIELENIAREIEQDHEIAIFQYADFLRRKEAEKQLLIEAQRQRDLKIAEEASARAKFLAEQAAKENADRLEREKQEAIDREINARIAAKEAERARINADLAYKESEKLRIEQAEIAEEKAKQDAIDYKIAAEKMAKQVEIDKIKAEELAEERSRIAAEISKQAEIKRQSDELKSIENARMIAESNKAHAAKIHNEMMQAAIAGGVEPAQAKAFVILLAKGAIPHISKIQY